MNKNSTGDEQHVLETERIVIKDEVVDDEGGGMDPMFVDRIKTEPEDIIEFEDGEEYDDSYNTISIDGIESCKIETNDHDEQPEQVELNLDCDTVVTESGVIIEKIYPDQEADKSKEENVPETHCHICNKEFRRHSALIGHIQSHFTDERDFDCDICNKCFKTKSHLQRHREIHFRKEIIYNCDDCSYSTKFKEKFNKHRISCLKSYILYKCLSCKFETKDCKVRDEHLKVHELQKSGNFLYKCRLCGFKTKDVITKNNHMKIHTIYKCRRCQYVTKFENSKSIHEATAHLPIKISPVKNYQCETCSENFTDPIKFFEHKKVHSKVECKECGAFLNNKSNMLFHRLSHVGESSNVCNVCGSSFSMQTIYDIHENFHKEKLNSKCEICGKQFVKPSQLFLHYKERHTRTVENLQAKVSIIRKQYGKSSYVCTICGVQCSGIVEYTRHKLSHIKKNDETFNCSICNVSFKNVLELIKHRKTH
ncbi:hypothetical protein L9F63_013366 [Diploptera punctata]|uniref:C2H2-type domain-containing protein n=1 Tax=Diploptera punctata TaxID=6984 RepID=A0AAD8AB67_DIPPU|nr:hypothetical protein L9F63_013366 [Diploptera punctata]